MKASGDSNLLGKPHRPYVPFGAGMVAGLLLGLFVGSVVLNGGPSSGGQQAATSIAAAGKGAKGEVYADAFKVVNVPGMWSPLPLYWKRLGPFAEAGRAPVTFSTPNTMYAYGGISHPLPADVISTDVVLKIDVAEVKGIVGVSLVNPSGEPIVTQEQGVTEADGERSIFIKVGPKQLPAGILFRNYGDASGQPGSIKVKQVSYAALSAFSDAQLGALNKIGLNKPLN